MSEVLIPVAYQLGIGGIGGFFVGYVIRKVTRIAIIIGVFVFSLAYLAYANVINIDYDALTKLVGVAEPALGLFTPLASVLPFLGSFFVGLLIGLKRG